MYGDSVSINHNRNTIPTLATGALSTRYLITQNNAAGRYTVLFRQYSEKRQEDQRKTLDEKIAGDIEKNIEKRHNTETETEPEKKRIGISARIKYFLLRQNRPFNIDEITAFFSWILMGNFIWIIIGTTTFFGVLIYILNWIGDGEVEKLVLKKLLTFDNKLNVDFSGPNFKATWEDGKIKIRNLKVHSSTLKDNMHLNYQLDIAEINLTFSFNKWFDGKGLIDGIEIEGLQGDVNMLDGEELILDESFHNNYELNHLKVKHSKINFHSETLFNKPLELVVFNCDMDRLRREWMVYDFLNANTMFGSLGGSLFTLHKRQHRFAHFSGMDLHDEADDYNNSTLKSINETRQATTVTAKDTKTTNTGSEGSRFGSLKYEVSNESNDNYNDYTTRMDADTNNNGRSNKSNDFWKKITRLRIDMLDLSFLNNENSKLNWIESGKAEIIFDIMLPNEDGDDDERYTYFGGSSSLKKDLNFEFSVDGVKRMFQTIYRKLTTDDDIGASGSDASGTGGSSSLSGVSSASGGATAEMNKYVVIDMKINYFNLTAKYPNKLPCSSLTGLPYITAKDLHSLVTFINDEKFGLSSARFTQLSNDLGHEENPFDRWEMDGDDAQGYEDSETTNSNIHGHGESHDHNGGIQNTAGGSSDDSGSDDGDDLDDTVLHGDGVKMLPPIKFRIVQNLNDFEYLDLPSLLSFTSMEPPEPGCDEKVRKSFVNTNKFIDGSIVEVLALLLVYKEEIQTRLIDMYSRRSGFEILFNNFILGNLILVGLGSFVI